MFFVIKYVLEDYTDKTNLEYARSFREKERGGKKENQVV